MVIVTMVYIGDSGTLYLVKDIVKKDSLLNMYQPGKEESHQWKISIRNQNDFNLLIYFILFFFFYLKIIFNTITCNR